ncbi:CAMK family protein kinase [Tritrichomonas foetus]|uniref:CAMK family protein kinase n=1 Tax=Tritrichomonas foetus TaxID=1144522 RepID=A0A1J4L5L0_9EUKA|nr:CAMK family protein kinase [Tritrichomonas foetus]|eukprot:OHT17237.1 CAMK family protein kinase [Tritrichomonas foetus]
MNDQISMNENSSDSWEMFQDVVHVMSMDQIMERYKFLSKISQNRNATIRLSLHIRTGEYVVMKILNKSAYSNAKKKLLLYREILTMQALGNKKHITELYEVIDSGDRIWVVMEFASGGELFHFVKSKAPLSENVAREIFRPIVRIVSYMHSLNIVHRDLKLENVLLDSNGRLMLADFGFSRRFENDGSLVDSICGTPHYSPPEIIKGIPNNPIYVDSWSLGVILFMLLFGQFPFNGLSIPDLLQNILKAEFHFPFQVSESATDLINRLLVAEPSARLTATEILNHKWINKNYFPKQKKANKWNIIHSNVIQKLGLKDVDIDRINECLDENELISYKIYRRNYQTGKFKIKETENLPLLDIPEPNDKDDSFNDNRPKTTNEPRFIPSVMGMTSARARKLLSNGKFLQVFKMDVGSHASKKKRSLPTASGILHRKPNNNIHARHVTAIKSKKYRFRSLQTMRMQSMTDEDMKLPNINCQHSTMDKPSVVWKKLLDFIDKNKDISIISEQDYSMYMLVNKPNELYVVFTLGCLHKGIGLIGYSLYKIRGEDADFAEFETSLENFLSF